jgi:chloramphenicol-sensitive protein RarD
VTQSEQSRARTGVLFGIGAYGLWGVLPVYFKAVARVAPLEVLAHRAVWSVVVLSVVVGFMGRWRELWRKLREGRTALMLAASSLLIAVNWLIFIYAVESRQVVQASLGYFINPLVSVLLGVVLLGERLRPYQLLSIAMAATGVLLLTAMIGEVPLIALMLAFSFAFYGLMRKLIPLDGLMCLVVETLAIAPLSFAYIVYLVLTGKTDGTTTGLWILLVLAGPVTVVPLLFFGGAARRLRLATLGFLQYLAPTLQFLVAVALFREPFSTAQAMSFACIWTAIGIYTWDSVQAVQDSRVVVLELE